MEPRVREIAAIDRGRQIVARQRELVEALGDTGHDTATAEHLLGVLTCSLNILEDILGGTGGQKGSDSSS